MASLFLNAEVPYKGALVMQRGFEEEIVEDNSRNWEMLAGSLRQAQEVEAAIPAMERAAEKSDNGDLYARLGSIYLDAEQNAKAIEAITKGLERGGVKRADQARLVLGMANFNQKNYRAAREAFQAAGRDERSEKYARQWIKYMDSEIKREQELQKDS
jgi:tetratricopeptide (TPR) repeat protein